MKQKIRVNGIDRKIPSGMNLNEIEKLINLDSGNFLAERNHAGRPLRILNKNQNIPKKSNLRFETLPRFEQGYDSRKHRINQEITHVSRKYPVIFDESNFNYIAIKNFPLNHHYNYRKITLLIKLGKDYPHSPPIHFFLKTGVRYKNRKLSHNFEDTSYNEMAGKNWSKYCLHIRKNSWKPVLDIISGDYLLTFIELINFVLNNPEKESV